MNVYGETTVFGPYNNGDTDKTALLVVDAGTGSVSLEVEAGADNWIVQELFEADAVKRVIVQGGRWRCVVTGNAVFGWAA